MKVLVFLDFFTPAFKAGGPIRIFETLARHDEPGVSIHIATQNCDWGDPSALGGVSENQWQAFDRANVFYAKPGTKPVKELCESLQPDAIHLNSVFSRTWTMPALFLRRFGRLGSKQVFLSPHGEFAASALAIKPSRKRVFLLLARILGLFRGLVWIATSEKEMEEIRKIAGRKAVVKMAAPPLPEVSPRAPSQKKKGELRLVFLARLSSMKNIGHLLQVLPQLSGKVTFDIYGPADGEYAPVWDELLKRFRSECQQVQIHAHGPVPSTKTLEAYQAADLFVQPSLGENFGYSIVEALAAGTPALISDRTPWNQLGDEKIGAALALEKPEEWVRFMQSFIDMDAAEWTAWSQRAHAWVRAQSSTARDLFKIYESSSASGSGAAQRRHSREDAKTAKQK